MEESEKQGGRSRNFKSDPQGQGFNRCPFCEVRQDVDKLRSCLEHRFECLAGITCEGIVVHQDGKLIYANEPFARMFGYSPEEICERKLSDLIAPESPRPLTDPGDDGLPIPCEAVGIRKDGGRFPLEIRVREVPLDGQVFRIVACRDVTLQKQHERQIEAILESSDDQILVIDRNHAYLYINEAAVRWVGMRKEDFFGKNTPEILQRLPESFQVWKDRIDQVLDSGQPMRCEDECELNQKHLFLQSVLFPIRYPDGGVFAVGIIARDITEQKMLQRQLEEREAKYRQLYIDSPIPLYRSRISDGKVLECNHAMARLAGFDSREEFLSEVFTTDYYVDPKARAELIQKLQKEKRVEGFQFEARRRDGSTIWVELSAEIYPEQGYIEGTQRDVTVARLLTKAEQTVLALIHEGLSNKEIARRLGKSVRTIEDHRRNLMQKLNLDNIVDLINRTKSFVREQQLEQ